MFGKEQIERMGRKIFVSYKYWDHDVEYLSGYSSSNPKARDYVDWIENYFTNKSDHIYKGENNGEDLSDKSDEYIWSELKDRIYDSTVTIVLISPGMKEQGKWERNQWIPWEISYSIKEMTRGGYTSRSNAILAVVLPDHNGSYSYQYWMNQFRIIQENIDAGYIMMCDWDSFVAHSEYYINKAIEAKENTPSYKIRKNV